MQNKDLISVIVPIYKVENYLNKCIDSILNQTYKNLEIILVDDGSPDNCPTLCDELAKKDKRIKVIHKSNGGLSDARNVGIEAANGKYIAFIDSDDFINKYFFETLYTNLMKTASDLSICGYQKVIENETIDISINPKQLEIQTFENIDKFKQLYTSNSVKFIVAWNKLYKAEIFKDSKIRYPLGKIHEDEFIIHEILNTCKKVCFADTPLYYYLNRDGSIMNQKLSEKNTHIFSALEVRSLFFKENYPELLTVSLNNLISKIIKEYFKYNKAQKFIINKIFKKIKLEFKTELKNFPLKQKIKILLFSRFRFILQLLYLIKK